MSRIDKFIFLAQNFRGAAVERRIGHTRICAESRICVDRRRMYVGLQSNDTLQMIPRMAMPGLEPAMVESQTMPECLGKF